MLFAGCETGIKAEMQLHATDITMPLALRAHFIFTTLAAGARVRGRGLDTVSNAITALPLNYIIQINFTAW